MREKIPVGENGQEVSRRKFLVGLGALGASIALPKEALTQATLGSSKEHIAKWEKYIEDWVLFAKQRLAKSDVREAFEARGENAFSRVLQALETPLLAEHANYTKFNTNPIRNTYPVQVGKFSGSYNLRQFDVMSFLRKKWAGYFKSDEHAGNGFFFGDRNTLIVPRHVNEIFHSKPFFTKDTKHTVDVMSWKVPDSLRAINDGTVLQDPEGLTNKDIHGSLVAVVGIDPGDRNASKLLEHKVYLGIAGKMSADLYRARGDGGSLLEVWEKFMDTSFQIILPPGETREDSTGMSGSPVFMWRNEAWTLCGIYYASLETEDSTRKKTVHSGVFHGIDQIRDSVRK